jgi:hypothetical protein
MQNPKMHWLSKDKPLQRYVLAGESQWKAKITLKSESKVAETIKRLLCLKLEGEEAL